MTRRLPAPALSLLTLGLALATPAFCWGPQGHAAVGLAGSAGLTPGARAHVIKILGDDNLAAVASWMDQARAAVFHDGPLAHDPEVLKFNADFRHNGEWHYVDLPLGTPAYTLDDPFAKPDDVVHELEAAVDRLEGKGDPKLTEREALFMIVHLVGDLHQPMHTANGYFVVNPDSSVKLVTDPAAAKDLPNDKGGNTDFYGPGKYDELHAYWDGELPEKVAGSKDAAALYAVMQKGIAANGASWKTPGDYHHWPEAWATESLIAARTAYAGIVFGKETEWPKGGIKRIEITFPPNYDSTCVPLAAERLAKAGYHLAEILNAIQWSDQ
jgi:hypothetical protein